MGTKKEQKGNTLQYKIKFNLYLLDNRYTLYEIPFYDKRLEELQIFDTAKKINDYLTPFQALQLQKKNAQEQATINM